MVLILPPPTLTTGLTPQLALVTENPHKVTEWQAICANIAPWLAIVAVKPDHTVDEKATTFEGNALLKAKAGLPGSDTLTAVIGEDAGVIIPALTGTDGLNEFPGLRSNRWFTSAWADKLGIADTGSAGRNQAILKLMEGQPDRRCIYRCTLAALQMNQADVLPLVTTGEWHLQVGTSPYGSGGFGYDPIMLTDAGHTVASLSADEKNRYSHRAKAIQALLQQMFKSVAPL